MTYTLSITDTASDYFGEDNYCNEMTFVSVVDLNSNLAPSVLSDLVTTVGTDSTSLAVTLQSDNEAFVTETTTFTLQINYSWDND